LFFASEWENRIGIFSHLRRPCNGLNIAIHCRSFGKFNPSGRIALGVVALVYHEITMTIFIRVASTSVRAVVKTQITSSHRVQTLNFRKPKGNNWSLSRLRYALSVYVADANERRNELDAAWSLECYRKGRKITAVSKQRILC
jgi:hypothetical protein